MLNAYKYRINESKCLNRIRKGWTPQEIDRPRYKTPLHGEETHGVWLGVTMETLGTSTTV